MGLKDFLVKQAGKRYKNMDFLKRNKAYFGTVFGLVGAYVWQFGCPGLASYCGIVAPILTTLGSFLVGAGLLDSDYRQKFVQGKVNGN